MSNFIRHNKPEEESTDMSLILKAARLIADVKMAKEVVEEGSKLIPQPIKDEAKERAAQLGKQAGKVALDLTARFAPSLKKRFDDEAEKQRKEKLKRALAQTRAQAAALRRQEEALAAELENGSTSAPAKKRAAVKKAAPRAKK